MKKNTTNTEHILRTFPFDASKLKAEWRKLGALVRQIYDGEAGLKPFSQWVKRYSPEKTEQDIKAAFHSVYETDNPMRDLVALVKDSFKGHVDPELNDVTLRDLFIDLHGKNFKVEAKTFYEWNPHRKLWLQRTSDQFVTTILEVLPAAISSGEIRFTDVTKFNMAKRMFGSFTQARTISTLLSLMDRELYGTDETINGCPDHLPLPHNKILNLRTLQTRQREKKDFFSHTVPFPFNMSANQHKVIDNLMAKGQDIKWLMENQEEVDAHYAEAFPSVHRFLRGSLASLPRRNYLRRTLGLSLTGDTRDRSAYILYGHGKGGKSKILEATLACLGEQFATVVRRQVVVSGPNEKGSEHTAHLLPLCGKRMAYVSETKVHDRLNTPLVKNIASGECVVVRPMYEAERSFWATLKLFTLSNYKILLENEDEAILDRVKVITMDTRYWDKTTVSMKPHNWNSPDYEDFEDVDHGIWWKKMTPESKAFAESMKMPRSRGGHVEEFFQMLCVSAWECFRLLDDPSGMGVLPVPPEVQADSNDFWMDSVRTARSKATNNKSEASELLTSFLAEHKVLPTSKEGSLLSDVYVAYTEFAEKRKEPTCQRRTFSALLTEKGLYNRLGRTKDGNVTKILLSYTPFNPLRKRKHPAKESTDATETKELKTKAPPLKSARTTAPTPVSCESSIIVVQEVENGHDGDNKEKTSRSSSTRSRMPISSPSMPSQTFPQEEDIASTQTLEYEPNEDEIQLVEESFRDEV